MTQSYPGSRISPTWSGRPPCFTAHGGLFLSIDQDTDAKTATDYLKLHHYDWQDFNDTDSKLSAAFRVEAVPDVILMDSTGKVVYDTIGGDEASLRRAIAKLGPQFQALAPPSKEPCSCAASTLVNSNEHAETSQ